LPASLSATSGFPAGFAANVDRLLAVGGALLALFAVFALVGDDKNDRELQATCGIALVLGVSGLAAGVIGLGSVLLNLASWMLYLGGITSVSAGILYIWTQYASVEGGRGRPR